MPVLKMLTYSTNQCAIIITFVSKRPVVVIGSSVDLRIWNSSVTCNVTVTHDECVIECTRFGINALNPKTKQTINLNTKVWNFEESKKVKKVKVKRWRKFLNLKKVKRWSLDKCNHRTATKMKRAKVRVEPKTIHTADIRYTSTTMLLKWQSQHFILVTLLSPYL